MVKLGHSKTTRVIQVVNTIIVLILVFLRSQIENRTTPETANSETFIFLTKQKGYNFDCIERKEIGKKVGTYTEHPF